LLLKKHQPLKPLLLLKHQPLTLLLSRLQLLMLPSLRRQLLSN
jgi:hypothetical protein